MAEHVDAQELVRHQRDFGRFMNLTVTVIVMVVIVLSGMAIFLL